MLRRAFAAVMVLVPSVALAAGLTFGENGAKALSLGGAFAGQADDLTAVQHNPAGLAQLRGTGVLLDVQLLSIDSTFQSRVANTEPARNAGGPFLLPFVGLSHTLTVADRALTIAFAAYGPPTVGRFHYNRPNYTRSDGTDGRPRLYVENPRKYAPQRFGLITSDTIILFPGPSVAYQVHKRFAVGASFQFVFSKMFFEQTITTSDAIGVLSDDPQSDALVTVDMNGKPSVTGVLGVLATPLDNFQIGASFRPPTKVSATGKMIIELGELAQSGGAQITGDEGDLELTLPMELKIGTHWRPIPAVGVNVDFVYEGWQSFSAFVLTPRGITQAFPGQEPKALSQIRLPKKWHHTIGARAGGSYKFGSGLEVRAGVLLEQQAAPNEYFNVDFPHLGRAFVTGGLSYPVGPVEVAVGGAFTPSQSLVVDNSDVRQVTSDPANPGLVVGNGTYTSGGWIATLGLRGRFGVPRAPPVAVPPPDTGAVSDAAVKLPDAAVAE